MQKEREIIIQNYVVRLVMSLASEIANLLHLLNSQRRLAKSHTELIRQIPDFSTHPIDRDPKPNLPTNTIAHSFDNPRIKAMTVISEQCHAPNVLISSVMRKFTAVDLRQFVCFIAQVVAVFVGQPVFFPNPRRRLHKPYFKPVSAHAYTCQSIARPATISMHCRTNPAPS